MSVDKMSVEKMSVDKMPVDKMSVDKMSVDKMSVEKMSVDKMSEDKMSVDKMSVDEVSSCSPQATLTVAFVRLVVLAAVVDAVALQVLGDAEGGAAAEELLAPGPLLDLGPHGLEAFGSDGLIRREEPGSNVVISKYFRREKLQRKNGDCDSNYIQQLRLKKRL
jgi:hypothetical protein